MSAPPRRRRPLRGRPRSLRPLLRKGWPWRPRLAIASPPRRRLGWQTFTLHSRKPLPTPGNQYVPRRVWYRTLHGEIGYEQSHRHIKKTSVWGYQVRTTRGVTIWRKPVTNHPLGFLRGDGIISGFTPAQVHAAVSSFSARAVCTRHGNSAIAAPKAAATQTMRSLVLRCSWHRG